MRQRYVVLREEGSSIGAVSLLALFVLAGLIALLIWQPWGRPRDGSIDDGNVITRRHQRHAINRTEIIMANDTNDKLNTLKGDSKDALDEVKNRAQATGERLKREVAGDSMPLGDRIVSNVKEAVHSTKADYDATKRDVRHDGDDLDKV